MRRVVRDAAKHFFDLESGWLRTARELTLSPGPMIRRFVQGRRRVYVNPFAYLVLATAASFLVQKIAGFNDRMVANIQTNSLSSPLQMEFVGRFTELMFQNTLYISFGVLVPLAVLLRFFFRKSGYNLAESLVFSLYAGGHMTLLGVVLIPLYMLLPPSAALQSIVAIAAAIAYTVYAARGFFDGPFIVVALKTIFAYVMSYVMFMVVMMACVMVYLFTVMLPTASGEDWDLITATNYNAVPVIEKLLDEGADVNMTLQRTPLHAAAENGNLEIVNLLIEGGADVNFQDIHGRTPLFVAVVERQTEVARRLTEAGSDATLLTADGSSIVIAAIRAENLGIARWALENGVDVNAFRPEKVNATALILAARRGNLEIAKLLLDHGADPNLTNRKDQKALDIAKGREVKDLLRPVTD